jgi:hypothetical protein
MIQARYVYQNHLYGEWVPAEIECLMVPNPEFAHTLLGVEFKDDKNDAPPQPNSRKRSKAKNLKGRRYNTYIPNGANNGLCLLRYPGSLHPQCPDCPEETGLTAVPWYEWLGVAALVLVWGVGVILFIVSVIHAIFYE